MPAKRRSQKTREAPEEGEPSEVVEEEEPAEEGEEKGEKDEQEEEEPKEKEKEEDGEASDDDAAIIKKRPAAWHSPDDEPAKKKKVQASWLGSADDKADGEADGRMTSRCQRAVFVARKNEVEPSVWERYAFLMDPKNKVAGKRAEINAIINSHVQRDAVATSKLAVKSRTVAKVVTNSEVDRDVHSTVGLGKWTTIGKIFSGSEACFKEACAAGEVLQGQDGHYYCTEHCKSHITEKGESASSTTKWDPTTGKEVMALMLKLSEDMADKPLDSSWAKIPMKLDDAPVVDNDLASDGDFKLMQESFDCTTRVTLNIRRVGMALSANRNSTTLRDMGRRALQLCKDIVEPSETLEKLLTSDRDVVRKPAVKEVLAKIAPPYKQMVELHNEMVQILKNQKGIVMSKDINLKANKL